jgi:hypothetical protein
MMTSFDNFYVSYWGVMGCYGVYLIVTWVMRIFMMQTLNQRAMVLWT